MKILLVTQYFYPENFKSNDIAFELVKKGHEVDVLCGIPNYPQGSFYKGYGVFKRRREVINGATVYRVYQVPRGKSMLGLVLNYLSYMLTASIWILFHLFKKYDCSIVHQPSPIMQGIPAVLLRGIKKIPLYFWVLDLWPDSMMSEGKEGVKNKRLLYTVDIFVRFIYRNCDKILISSKGFEDSICSKGNFKSKIIYFPNWSEDVFCNNIDAVIPTLPSGFKIMLAGNLGTAQNLDAVMDAALKKKDDNNIKWIIIGDGSRKRWLDQFIIKHELEKTVYAIGRFPLSDMPAFYKQADVMLVTLSNEYYLRSIVPARLQSYMAAKKPVLGLIDGATAELIKESDCGYAVGPKNIDDFLLVLDEILKKPDLLVQKGVNGYEYFEKNFSKKKCIDHLLSIIDDSK